MRLLRSLLLCIVAALSAALPAQAEEALTLEQALAVARKHAPLILSARYRVVEARGRLAGASVFQQENPEVFASAGPRFTQGGEITDYEISLSQTLELGGRRAARIAGARAGVDREAASSSEVLRLLLKKVSAAFAHGLAAQERLRIATAAEGLANELLDGMQRRYEAGDVPILDVNLARGGAARARAQTRAAQAHYASAVGELRVLLGMGAEQPLTITGDLRDRKRYELETLVAHASQRPDLRVLAAEIREAESQLRLGRASAYPDISPGFSYKRDSGDSVYQGSLTFTLPVFRRGQELKAVGAARSARLNGELQASTRAVAVEVHTAYAVYRSQVAAVEELERNALPSVDENETLGRRSFEEGEIGLYELLLIRRESFETRVLYTERLLEAAIAGIELEARAGVLQ
jgi:cobalt-zinc-cadmium efflux system outer membrane protein